MSQVRGAPPVPDVQDRTTETAPLSSTLVSIWPYLTILKRIIEDLMIL